MSMRSDCRYGACGPPVSGPSSQSRPSQWKESSSWLYDSSVLRATSVSSMRKTMVPLWCRANAQLNRAVRNRPTWGLPVGEGQKRTRTGAGAGAGADVDVGSDVGSDALATLDHL